MKNDEYFIFRAGVRKFLGSRKSKIGEIGKTAKNENGKKFHFFLLGNSSRFALRNSGREFEKIRKIPKNSEKNSGIHKIRSNEVAVNSEGNFRKKFWPVPFGRI